MKMTQEQRRASSRARERYQADGYGPATPPEDRAKVIRRMRREGITWSDCAGLFGISVRQAVTIAEGKTTMLVTARERKIIMALRSGRGTVEMRPSSHTTESAP